MRQVNGSERSEGPQGNAGTACRLVAVECDFMCLMCCHSRRMLHPCPAQLAGMDCSTALTAVVALGKNTMSAGSA